MFSFVESSYSDIALQQIEIRLRSKCGSYIRGGKYVFFGGGMV